MRKNDCKSCGNLRPRFDPERWIADFYKPVIDMFRDLDIHRCEDCGRIYQMSWIQSITCFVLVLLLFLLVSLIPNLTLSLVILVIGYPITFEIPRKLLPWKEVGKDLYYVRWKSRLGLVLSQIGGAFAGAIISVMLL